MEEGGHSTRHSEHLKESPPRPRDVLPWSSPSLSSSRDPTLHKTQALGSVPSRLGSVTVPASQAAPHHPLSEEECASNLANWAE